MNRLAVMLAWLFIVLTSAIQAGELEDALNIYQRGDFIRATSMLRPLADHGDGRAQVALYRIYLYGKGTTIDFVEALKWARSSASLGNPDGEYGVALAYSFGLGVDRDSATGLHWLRKAADDGSREAQAWLAARYLRGDGVPQRSDDGLRYLDAAADNGLARAIVALAQIRNEGAFGQPKDPLAARALETRAAELRFFPAQLDLAMALAQTDTVEAATWAILATTTGCNVGGKAALLPPKLSKTDLEKAVGEASLWDKSHPPVDLDQYDQTINICNLNHQRIMGPVQPPNPTEPVKQDTTGKGAVMCIWFLYASVEATVDACGLPATPMDGAIKASLVRIGHFIIENSHPPISEAQLNNSLAGIKNQQIMTMVQPTGGQVCEGQNIAPFRQGTPEQLEKAIDNLLSIPREPLMNPCL